MTFTTAEKSAVVLSGQKMAAYVGTFVLVTVMVVSTSHAANEAPAPRNIQQLVAAAAEAEVAGDAAKASTLLQDAVKADPNNQIARWQLGQLQVNGTWLPAEEAQQRAAKDPIQTEYRQRRAAAGRNVADQAKLARWCRDNKLGDEAQLHWGVVLSLEPANKEALRAVDMLWKDGQLVARNQSSQLKGQSQTAKASARRWEPLVAKWRRAVAGRDILAHDSALAEIRAIHELEAIPFIEAATLGRDANNVKHAEECLQIAVAFIDALSKMPDEPATESLVRHAAFSPGNKARALAIEKLKSRDEHDYVPMLLSGIAMPIESSFDVRTDADGSVFYTHALYREGQDTDWSYNLRKSAVQYQFVYRDVRVDRNSNAVELLPNVNVADNMLRRENVAHRNLNRYGSDAAQTEAAIAAANEQIEVTNALVINVLTKTTGKSHESPRAWWDWWRDQNEYYTKGDRPVEQHYDSETSQHVYVDLPAPEPSRHSCFAKGTVVWTKTGKRPIESLELGDFVLAQDENTGELSYKPVLARTVRPPSPMLKVALETEEFQTTPGHPFWVAGVGWRMAKDLGEGAVLHGVKGPVRVKSICRAEDGEAFNLIVSDLDTYFVGNTGILVHDVVPRGHKKPEASTVSMVR